MNTENNKLIAEFMGVKLPYKNSNGNWEYMVEGAGLVSSPNIEDLNRFLSFRYDKDWNLLMQVVEKIKPLNRNGNYNYSRLMNMTLQEALNIEVVYKHTVSFIEWYNKNGGNKN